MDLLGCRHSTISREREREIDRGREREREREREGERREREREREGEGEGERERERERMILGRVLEGIRYYCTSELAEGGRLICSPDPPKSS